MLYGARMSRTDKDRPHWVRSNDPQEPRRFRHHCMRYWSKRECVVGPSYRRDDARDPGVTCCWEYDYRRKWYESAPRWYIASVYHDPERTNARDILREAAKEWNATGDTDLEPINRQARNDGIYYW